MTARKAWFTAIIITLAMVLGMGGAEVAARWTSALMGG
jgi:hypothetical protein